MKFSQKFESALLQGIDRYYAIRPQAFPGAQRLHECKIVAHRGEHDNQNVFENTLPAFDRARDQGVWGIEFDVRWTKDLQPVVVHDPNLQRVFGQNLDIHHVTLSELKSACPLVPALQEVVRRYGKTLHLMIEIKAEIYPAPVYQNQVLADIFSALKSRDDFHILSLTPQMFTVINFVPKSTFIPIVRLNFSQLSRLALTENFGGIAGHYFFLTTNRLKKHFRYRQKAGTGYIGSKNCLFRELNRGVDWIFSNNAARLQKTVVQLLQSL
jgi:glycerophosphoryl diester phosphodiesterase